MYAHLDDLWNCWKWKNRLCEINEWESPLCIPIQTQMNFKFAFFNFFSFVKIDVTIKRAQILEIKVQSTSGHTQCVWCMIYSIVMHTNANSIVKLTPQRNFDVVDDNVTNSFTPFLVHKKRIGADWEKNKYVVIECRNDEKPFSLSIIIFGFHQFTQSQWKPVPMKNLQQLWYSNYTIIIFFYLSRIFTSSWYLKFCNCLTVEMNE